MNRPLAIPFGRLSCAAFVLLQASRPAAGQADARATFRQQLGKPPTEMRTFAGDEETRFTLQLGTGRLLVIEGNGTVEGARKANHLCFRRELRTHTTIRGPEEKAYAGKSEAVCDGATIFTTTHADGRVYAFEYPPSIANFYDARLLAETPAPQETLTLLPKEEIDGHGCHVIRIAQPTVLAPMGAAASWVLHIRQDCGIVVRAVGFDAKGNEVASRRTKSLRLGGEVSSDRFAVKKPADSRPEGNALDFAPISSQLDWITMAAAEGHEAILDYLGDSAADMQDKEEPGAADLLWQAIAALDPHISEAWTYRGWYSAYALSEAAEAREDRWNHIMDGIRILHQGVARNESSASLCHQMSWTFFHRIGERLDAHHLAFKRVWATRMETLLGPMPDGAPPSAQAAQLAPVAAAPSTIEELTAARAGVGVLAQRLGDAGVNIATGANWASHLHPLEQTFFRRYADRQADERLGRLRRHPKPTDPAIARLYAVLDAADPGDLKALVAYLRAKVLREHYRMDPVFMHKLGEQFGETGPLPIDWRTPWAHSLYWALAGMEKGRQNDDLTDLDVLNGNRIVLYALGSTFTQGDFLLQCDLDSPWESPLIVRPSWDYARVVHRAALKMIEGLSTSSERQKLIPMFHEYHATLLDSMAAGLFLSGRETEAELFFEYVAKHYVEVIPPERKELYRLTFREAMQRQLGATPDSKEESLHGQLCDAYLTLGRSGTEEYQRRLALARSLVPGRTDSPGASGPGPSFEELQADALTTLVTIPEVPLLVRVAAWQRAEAGIKQACHDRVQRGLEKDPANGEWDLARAFPEP